MISRPLRVLLVDDNAALRENLAECLEAEGHQVLAACDGNDALGVLSRQARPDVVVLDLIMPGLDGREVAAVVRRSPELRDLRLVLMTGHASDAVSACKDVDAVLEKPFGLAQLFAALQGGTAARV
jgi:CheY-like chemotaxis protein